MSADDYKRFLANVKVTTDWLANQEFGPDGSFTPEAPSSDPEKPAVKCTECGKLMKHRSGKSRKTGDFYSGWFCDNKDHPPVWDEAE